MAQTGGWLPGSLIQCITHSGLGWGRVIGATFNISCYYSVSTSFKFYVTQWGRGGGEWWWWWWWCKLSREKRYEGVRFNIISV